MPTALKLSEAQIADLRVLRQGALNFPGAVGAWSEFYQYLARVIINKFGVSPITTDPITPGDIFAARFLLPEDEYQAAIWLIGGAQVNSGDGVFSEVIREYNVRQGQLRLGKTFTSEELQLASNEVGFRMSGQILNDPFDEIDPGNGGFVPTVPEIGERDLNGVRDILYPGNKNIDNPLFLNQAWPGIIMLGKQGGDFVGRLAATGDASWADTLSDLQNLLYSWDSFLYAYEATGIFDFGGAKDLAIMLGITNFEDIDKGGNNLALLAGDWAKFFFDILIKDQDPVVSASLSVVSDIGAPLFLDMIRGSVLGYSVVGETTEDNFLRNARLFFESFDQSFLDNKSATILPRELDYLKQAAQEDVSVRAALGALSFVRVEATGSIAEKYKLLDPVSGDGEITDQWISDRAEMLISYNVYWGRDESDGVLSLSGVSPFPMIGDVTYLDLSPSGVSSLVVDGFDFWMEDSRKIVFGSDTGDIEVGGSASDHLFGMAGDDLLLGYGGSDYLEGGSGNDRLNGGDENDTLRGMSGNDELTGGFGSDYLDGGIGNDTYIFSAGFGHDTIVDIDGNGTIKFDGADLKGGTKTADNVYFNKDTGWTYVRSNGDLFLTRSGSSDSIRIVGWQEGRLGITLDNRLPVIPPVQANEPIWGDRQAIDFNPVEAGEQTHTDNLGNVVVNKNIIESGREDTLYDGAGNDQVYGYGGNDTIKGSGTGDDLLDGGSGDDWVDTGTGADTLIGGQGSDRVIGGTEGNRLYADEQLTDQQVIANNSDTLSVLARGDMVTANGGNDWVVGSVRNDLLMGGSGRDSLYGGGGNDVIYGDRYTAWIGDDWDFARSVTVTGGIAHYLVTMENMDNWLANPTDDDRDFLFGGAGDDWLFGESGQDYLEGNADNDVLFGGKDNDLLIGGQGNDTLVGDEGITSTGQDGDDILSGEDGDDQLFGDGGNDSLFGGADNDMLIGDNTQIAGALHGNDFLDGGSGNDSLTGLGGNDTLEGGIGDDLMYGDDVNHELSSEFYGRDVLRGGQGKDSLYGGGGADELRGGTEDDLLVGDGGLPNVDIAFHGDDSLYGEEGKDSLFGNGGNDTLDGGSENDTLVGGDGNDSLIGGTGDDFLYGEANDDVLIGGAGTDYFDGGLGNDTYRFSASDIDAGKQETIRDAGGTDTLAVTGQLTAGINGNDGNLHLLLGNPSEAREIFIAGGLFGTIEKLDLGSGSITNLRDWVNLNVTQALDLTTEQADSVFTGGGDDTITATKAGVTLDSGRGSDTLILSNAVAGGVTVKFAQGDGVDTVLGSVTLDPLAIRQANVAKFGVGVTAASMRLLGSPDASGVANLYVGYGSAGDRIKIDLSSSGLDISRPFDRFEFEDGSNVLWEQVAGLGVDYNAGASSLPVTVNGSLLNDRITGGSGGDHLDGGIGDDYINGAAGNDTLSSNLGVDTLVGGTGDDVISAYGVNGTVIKFSLGDGVDSLSTNYAYQNARSGDNVLQLGSGISLASLQLVQVAAGAYQLRIGSGGDAINFAMQSSDMAGSSRPFDRFVFSGGEEASWKQLVANGVEIHVTQADDVPVIGTNLNDRIIGNANKHTINAGAGDDRIESGLGSEVLVGGEGNDSYVFSPGFGTDIVDNRSALASEADRIIFSSGLLLSNASFVRMFDDLMVIFGGTQTLKVLGFFNNIGTETIEFADGSIFDRSNLPPYTYSLQALATLGDDIISLSGTDDAFNGLAGNDKVSGLEGSDSINGGDGADTINGGVGSDVLYGDADADLLEGGNGNDIIYGGSGNDALYGDDILYYGDDVNKSFGSDVLYGGSGDDFLYGDDPSAGLSGNDTLYGEDGADRLYGGLGDDSLNGGSGNDVISDLLGVNVVDGGAGDDEIYVSPESIIIFGAGSGYDQVNISNVQFVTGDLGGEWRYLRSVSSLVVMSASDYQDRILFRDYNFDEFGAPPVNENFSLSFSGGRTVTSVNASQSTGVYLDISRGTATLDPAYSAQNTYSDRADIMGQWGSVSRGYFLGGSNIGNDVLIASALSDDIDGRAGNDMLIGLAGNDTLRGGDGNDTLVGGVGNDWIALNGGSGSKTVIFNKGDGVDLVTQTGRVAMFDIGGYSSEEISFRRSDYSLYVEFNGSSDRINLSGFFNDGYNDFSASYSSTSMRLQNGAVISSSEMFLRAYQADKPPVVIGEQYNVFESLTLQSSDLLSNDKDLEVYNISISGVSDATHGAVVMNSSRSSVMFVADTGYRGLASFSYSVSDGAKEAKATVDLFVSQAYDILENTEFTINTSQLLLDDADSDYAAFEFIGIESAWGGVASYNEVTGIVTFIADVGYQGVADFSYSISDGVNTVSRSAQVRVGTLQNQIVAGTNEEEALSGSFGNDTLNGSGGADELFSYQGNDRLNGGSGGDLMVGGIGDDTYVVDNIDDFVIEFAGGGVDTVESSISIKLAANVEDLLLTGTSGLTGTGNDLDNRITGNSGANALDGGLGNDRLDGKAGKDTMRGGLGDDTYVVDSTTDSVIENLNEGLDVVESSVTFTLGANLENLTLTGTAAVNGTGNALNNNLTGNSAANRLDGGAGADSMVGGAGNDTYVVDNVGDTVSETSNTGGTDTVEASVSFALSANVENLTLTGLNNTDATGNTLANMLRGNAGNNRLDGGAGTDSLIGGAGNDTYVVDATTDVITENLNEGTDTVESSVTLTLGTNLENLVLTGSAALNGTGNALNNRLQGNAGVNSLTGAAGNDTLDGQGGNDSLTGGVGNDTYVLGRGYGADTVVESDTTAGNTDVAQFASGIATDQLWFTKAANNLEVSIIGTSDKLIIKDWYVGAGNHVEQFKTSDGKTLLDSQVQNLVNAMASFAPPAAGQTSLPTNYHSSLDTVIAANWK